MKIFLGLVMAFGFLFGLDINSASVKDLSSLTGVGKSKANAIVEFRAGHCFKNIEELSLVKGIGSKTVEKNRSNLTAGKCK